jgi:putative hydrolase of the HAD superfamily
VRSGMINLSGIKNIIFDLGGVILELDVNRTIEALTELGFPGLVNLESILTDYPFFLEFETGRISTDQFIDILISHAGDHTPRDKVIAAWDAMILGFKPENVELLLQIRDRYRLFLLSNTNSIHEKTYNDQLYRDHGIPNLSDLFEKVYYSHDLKMRKPDLEIFEYVLEDSLLVARETLYIDDTEEHVKSALQLGMHAYHLKIPEKITQLLCW